MSIQVKGQVNSITTEYFKCLDTVNLKVRFYQVGFGTLSEIGTGIGVNADGSFLYDIPTGVNSAYAKLLLLEDGHEFLIEQSSVACHHNLPDIVFNIDESKFGKPALDKIKSRLSEAGLTTLANITSLTEAQMSELSCASCVSSGSLHRLQTAYVLWNQLRDYNKTGGYSSAVTLMEDFRTVGQVDRGVSIFFGLLRFLSTSLHQAFSFSRNQFDAHLNECIDLNEITDSLLSSTNLDMLEACRNVLLMNAENDGEYYDAKLIYLSTNSDADKNTLMNSVLEGGGITGILKLDNTANSPALREVKKVKLLSNYLNNHAPFLKHVIDNEGGYELDFWSLASGEYDIHHADYWAHLLSSFTPLPAGYTKEQYAALINENIAIAEPSARLCYHLSGSSISGASGSKGILTAHKEFNIQEHSAARYFTTEPGKSNSITESEMQALTELQRTIKLSGETDGLTIATALYSNGTTSSSAIVNKDGGKAGFIRNLGTLLGGGDSAKTTANAIWCKAKANTDAATMAAIYYLRYEKEGALVPYGLNPYNANLPLQNNLPVGYPSNMIPDGLELPNMETLFGSFNTCSCSDCQSVYSPAAYLTDLLNWLRKDVVFPTTPFQSGLDALEKSSGIHRRRDIRHIKLSCENTNMLLPYIDIVNEILSVNLLPGTAGYSTTEPALTTNITPEYKKLQTTKTTEEIMVEPEHRFTASEDLLYGKSFPWVLPYNVAFDECLSVLKISGKEYHEVINDFSTENTKYNSDNWSAAYLNLNPQEVSLLTTINSGPSTFWKDYWGFDSSVTVPPLAGPVMATTGFNLDEIKDILSAYYVNGGTKINVSQGSLLCEVESYVFTPALTAACAENFMKLVRLKRKTGLSTWELDMAIMNSGGVINNSFLNMLAACMEFSKSNGISFSDLMVFFGNNSYHDVFVPANYSAYYENKFGSALLPASIRTFFAATPNYAANVNALSNEQKQFLSVTLQTDVPTLEKFISFLFGTSGVIGNGTIPFTSTILAHLHKCTLLVKIFNLDTTRLSEYTSLIGNVFSSFTIKSLWDFSTTLNRFNNLEVSFSDFIDLMTGAGDYTLAGLDTEAEKIWKDVEKAFQEARLANPDKDATAVAYATFYKDLVLKNIALHFGIEEADAAAIINLSYATWLATFITDPDGTTTARTWANKKAAFGPLHQSFNRINVLTNILGLDKVALANALLVKAGTLKAKSASATPFYWLGNSNAALTAAVFNDVLWVKSLTKQAGQLDIPQIDLLGTTGDVFQLADTYFNNFNTGYNNASNTNIVALYNQLGSSSVYKTLSAYEFTEIFVRARALTIASAQKDIVALLEAFENIYATTQVFKIKATDAWAWVWAGTNWQPTFPSSTLVQTFTPATTNYTLSADIRRTVNSMYPVFSDWSKVIVPVQNELRARMRDAFVGYYIGYKNGVDEDKLYAYYLLDTQMSPCMKTSRVVSAISSVQLLIHRAMLNLESGIYIDAEDKQEWEWRKNYRVWEANRKVFLYPENWIEPTLRKNKTYLFKEAEDLLQQDEINDRNSEQAFAGYLTGLNELAHLDVRAMYVEDPNADLAAGDGMLYKNNFNETIHVFARNWNPPFTYYYRQFTRGLWTGWDKLDVEIDSDHLIPVMFNRKLYLFFPLFVEKIYGQEKDAAGNVIGDIRYYEIQMCYTKLDFGKWSQKKVLPEKVLAGRRAFQYSSGLFEKCDQGYTGQATFSANSDIYSEVQDFWSYASMDKKDFYFWAENKNDGSLHIHCRRALDPKKRQTGNTYTQFAYEQGFLINACDERVEIVCDSEIDSNNYTNKFFLSRPYVTMPYFQQMKFGKAKFTSDHPDFIAGDFKMFAKLSVLPTADDVALMGDADKYILTYPQQYKHSIGGQPFFFTHPYRSYFFRYSSSAIGLRNVGAIGGPGGAV